MKISIIIPVYNLEQYIGKLLYSIQAQDYEDYEVILVNDGSTDRSVEVIKEIICADERFHLINQENQGPGAARNTGINVARGEYILFFDGDDFITEKTALSTLAKYAEKDFDILVYPVQHASNDDMMVHASTIKYEEIFGEVQDFTSVLKLMLKKGLLLSSPYEQMLKRSYLLKHELYFPLGIFSEDIEWIIRIMQTEPKIEFRDYQFYCYRWNRPESTCNSQKIKWEKERKIISFINYYYKELAVRDDLLSRLILSYISYHWCVAGSNVAKLDKKEERELGFKMLKETKDILRYDVMKKVKIFRLVSNVFGIKRAASLGAWRYNIKRKILR